MTTNRKSHGRERGAAKELKKLVAAGDAAAIARAQQHIHHFDPSRFSLMTAQHVVAREAGFASWSAMLETDE